MTNKEKKGIWSLKDYSRKYQISIQMWPNWTCIFIEKDHVELYSYGGAMDLEECMNNVVEYLDRINNKQHAK